MKNFGFTGGRPDPFTFPTEQLIKASEKALRKIGGDLVNYPGDRGDRSLRELASIRFERREGVPLNVDRISITSGSMQSLDLIFRTFLDQGDTILTEELAYSGTLSLLRDLNAKIVGVPLDHTDGMDIDALETILKDLAQKQIKPKMIYVTPNHQNPTGAILTHDRRKRLLEIADEYDLIVIEDDCYGDIDFIPNVTPDSLFKLDRSDRVIYVATFSKILGAGVRLGYFVAKAEDQSLIHHSRWDLGTSALSSAIVAEFFKEHLADHLAVTNAAVKAKCEAVDRTLEDQVGDLCSWTKPRGGLFMWVDLPSQTDLNKVEKLASEKGVGFSRGSAFHCQQKPIKALRIAYAYCHVDDIPEGIGYLCDAIRSAQC